MLLVSFTVYAVEKKDKSFLDRIKPDSSGLKEKKSTVAPEQQTTPIPAAKTVSLTPPTPSGVAECYLIQDPGEIASYFDSFAAGDVVAKYFDPVLYCEEPVYPLKIHEVDFVLYNFAGVGSVDMVVDVHIVCHDSCDGPGTRIYQSDPITITTFYPEMAHIDLEDVVCVYEPFFISLEYATGVTGSTPSFVWSDETYPCDTCHAWVYWASGGYPYWFEWHDFWSPPAGGCPIIRVSAATSDPDCQQEPCDTTLETLWGGTYPYYYWRNPTGYGDRYLNQRFNMPLTHGGRLDEIEIAFYDAGSGTPDPDIYVWLSDGLYPQDNNPPYQAIAEFNMTYGDIVWYPGWTVVQTYELGMEFDAGESFHIGYGHAYINGDTLCCLSDDGYFNSDRSVEWAEPGQWGTMLDDWDLGVDFLINAVICPNPIEDSTFTISCSPYQNSAIPGDPPAVLYQVEVGEILQYGLPVDLSCIPPAGINVSFEPDNVPAPYTSDVSVSVDMGTAYGDYTLTFCGTGADGQGPRCCSVKLTVQPPYDDDLVEFYHGKQRMTNFGAVGDHNHSAESFLWYGITDLLYDGTFVVATGPHNMALDFYRYHVHAGFVPSQHQVITYDPQWPANIGFAQFYTDPHVIPGQHDSLFVIGVMDECVDFSIKIMIYYNPTPEPIYDMYIALLEDWDQGDARNNWGGMDPAHNLAYIYEPLDSTLVCGLFNAPFYDGPMFNMRLWQNLFWWPPWFNTDTLWSYMTTPGYVYPEYMGPDSQDFSVLITPQAIDLHQGDSHIEIWIDFCRDTDFDGLTWSQWWHRVLRYVGFYRGDVNASDTLELPALDVSDLVYLIQYLFSNGPDPIPYVDQGDVNGNRVVNIADVVYMLNYVFENGPPPIDYIRFIPSMWTRESLFENPNWN